LPEKYFNSVQRNCYANLQNCFAQLTPLIIFLNPGFWALCLAGPNENRFFFF